MPELWQHERLQLNAEARRPSTGALFGSESESPSMSPSFASVGSGSRRIESHAGARRRGRAWLSGLLLCALAFVPGCISIDVLGGGEEAELVETVVRGRHGKKILLLDIDGVIGETDYAESLFGPTSLGTVARVAEVLDRARRDDEIAAVLLRIDTPGGTVTASEEVYELIQRFKAERHVPVFAQMLGMATSGGYYVAMAADTIQAHPTTVTGSIGVLFTSLSFAGLMEKVGVEDQTLTGGAFKDAGSPFRRLSDVERGQLQSIVDDLHARFREVVAKGRPKLSKEQIEALANGRVYSARQALENGLVDRVGSLEEAVVQIERGLGVPEARVVIYHRPREIRRNLYTRASVSPRVDGSLDPVSRALALAELERLLGEPGFHYIWRPGLPASTGD